MNRDKEKENSDNDKKPESAIFHLKDTHPERGVEADPQQAALKKELDEALKETFPASDPPSASQPTTIGVKKIRKPAA